MEASINLLSSSPFPLTSHFRTTSLSTSSVSMPNEQAIPAIPAGFLLKQIPASVLSLEHHDDFKLSTTLGDDKISHVQSTSENKMIEEIGFLRDHMRSSLNHLWDLEHELYHSSGLSYLLPSLSNEEHSTPGVLENTMNVESSDAISLAKEALSASKVALSLSGSSETLDTNFDLSLLPSLTDNLKVKKMVRSTRLLERKTKRRKSSWPRAIHESGSPIKALKPEPRTSSSERFDHSDPLRNFLSGPETKQLLTLAEEKTLIREVQEFGKLLAVKEQLKSQFEREPTFSEWGNAVGLSAGILRSKFHSWKRSHEKLIYANFRMVVYVAKQYQGRGLSLQDLMQVN